MRELMIESFFGGVTPNGFSTQLTQMVNGKEYYTYIPKGWPRNGEILDDEEHS